MTRIACLRWESTFIIYFIFVRISQLELQLLTKSIADHIKDLGPARCYWAIPIERYIGILKGIVRSIVYIDMNLANMVVTMEHRNWLFLRYQLKSQLEDEEVSED